MQSESQRHAKTLALLHSIFSDSINIKAGLHLLHFEMHLSHEHMYIIESRHSGNRQGMASIFLLAKLRTLSY